MQKNTFLITAHAVMRCELVMPTPSPTPAPTPAPGGIAGTEDRGILKLAGDAVALLADSSDSVDDRLDHGIVSALDLAFE